MGIINMINFQKILCFFFLLIFTTPIFGKEKPTINFGYAELYLGMSGREVQKKLKSVGYRLTKRGESFYNILTDSGDYRGHVCFENWKAIGIEKEESRGDRNPDEYIRTIYYTFKKVIDFDDINLDGAAFNLINYKERIDITFETREVHFDIGPYKIEIKSSEINNDPVSPEINISIGEC